MSKQINPLIKKAESLFHKGFKLADIAVKLDIPAGTVRRWKSENKWDNERSENEQEKTEQSVQKSSAPKKKRGPPKGNKNAVGNSGGGAPLGNVNHLKHGFYYDALLPDEQNMVESRSPISEENRLENAITLWELKIRRLLLELQSIKNGSALVVQSVTKDENGSVKSTAVSKQERIEKLEKLLTAAQNGHMRSIEALCKLRLEQQRLEAEEKDDGAVNDWINALLGDENG